jgi:hypothetical protein
MFGSGYSANPNNGRIASSGRDTVCVSITPWLLQPNYIKPNSTSAPQNVREHFQLMSTLKNQTN